MRQRTISILALAAILTVVTPPAMATCGGGGGGGTGGMMPQGGMAPKAYVVPWKVVTPETPATTAGLALYWFPASQGEVKGHELLTSRALTLVSAQCVNMYIVVPEDTASVTKWGVAGKQPTAMLVHDGTAVASVDAESGKLRMKKIEDLLRNDLKARETALDKLLDDAKAQEKANKESAIALYQQVWEQRCLAPKKGRGAQKALARLGVTVKDAQLRTIDPIDTPAMNRRMTKAMDLAFAAELNEDYAKARKLYFAATRIDPADPVPHRFFAELLRHHTGEWPLATKTFEHLLSIQPDPLSRAVALHGIGKIVIHMGNPARGLSLFEESAAAYPLALTYRNLAVYWNSEREHDKAQTYVNKALALDPNDAFNLVFAATYMADRGRGEEALRIAREHEGLLSASYNLAAIYALLGQKGKAMELLHRHFYQYERYDEVRAMEMWEARVDYVFATMKDDPEFVKLTAMAR